MIYFTGDTHFCHANILKYCSRPYGDIKDMDAELIKNWNATVKPEDEVYHLGDFALGGDADAAADILNQLNGVKYLVRGNHDKLMEKHSRKHGETPGNYFHWRKDYYEFKVRDEEMDLNQRIVLCHYPLQVWKNSHHGSWHLHGHCHGTLPSKDSMSRLDVGVDVHGMRPVSYEEIKAIMTRKVFKPVDHHGDDGRTAK